MHNAYDQRSKSSCSYISTELTLIAAMKNDDAFGAARVFQFSSTYGSPRLGRASSAMVLRKSLLSLLSSIDTVDSRVLSVAFNRAA